MKLHAHTTTSNRMSQDSWYGFHPTYSQHPRSSPSSRGSSGRAAQEGDAAAHIGKDRSFAERATTQRRPFAVQEVDKRSKEDMDRQRTLKRNEASFRQLPAFRSSRKHMPWLMPSRQSRQPQDGMSARQPPMDAGLSKSSLASVDEAASAGCAMEQRGAAAPWWTQKAKLWSDWDSDDDADEEVYTSWRLEDEDEDHKSGTTTPSPSPSATGTRTGGEGGPLFDESVLYDQSAKAGVAITDHVGHGVASKGNKWSRRD